MVRCNLHNGISKNDSANDEVVDMVHVIFTKKSYLKTLMFPSLNHCSKMLQN